DSNGDLKAQARWLEDDLTAAEARGAKHLFVMMHFGAYSAGKSIGHGSNDEAREHIVPVADRHRVDAMFAGHDHFYARGLSGAGMRYLVCGGGGAPLHDTGRISETQVTRKSFHSLVVDVQGRVVSIQAKDADGSPFDAVSFAREPL